MKKIFFIIGAILSCLGFLLSGCGGTFGNPSQKITISNNGAYANEFPANNPTYKHISTPSVNAKFVNSELTLEAWIKSNGGAGSIFARGDAGSGFILYVDSDNFAKFAVHDPSLLTPAIASGDIVVNDNNWHHLAGVLTSSIHSHTPTTVTCDAPAMTGTHVDIYVDGVWRNCDNAGFPASVDTCTTPDGPVACSNNMGRDLSPVSVAPGPTVPLFVGIIDEVRLWKEARDPGLISRWMNEEISGIEEWGLADPNNKITGYWKFNEGTGRTCTDSSGYGNSGSKSQCAAGTCGGSDEEFGPWTDGWVASYPFPY